MKRFISYLPGEIITQILLLLPFESILTCKLVSKQWRNLISDRKFFKLYNARGSLSLFLYKDDLYCLITRHHNKISGTVEGPRHPPFTVHHVPVDLQLGIWSECPTKPYLPSGSSNGIACVRRARRDFVLFNLFNRTSLIVDAPVIEFDPKTSRDDDYTYYTSWDCFGFGFNRDADDYNLVVAYMTYQLQPNPELPEEARPDRAVQVEGREEEEHQYWVYSVRDDVWKQLKGFPYAPYIWYQHYSRHASTIDGVLHWLVKAKESPNEPVIVTYDLHTSRFGTISLPHGFGLIPHMGYIFGLHGAPMVAELDGQLCCWRFWNQGPNSYPKFKMWVMKEYGATDSWVELINSGAETNYNHSSFELCGFEATGVTGLYECRNGRKRVLFVSHHHKRALFWYNIDNEKIKVIGKRIWSSREGNALSRGQDFGCINKFPG